MNERDHRCVEPYYQKMMGTNAVRYGEELLPAIVEMSRSTTSDEVVALLRSAWRETVMGAWLSLTRDDAEVTDALLHALSTSSGYLTSPPLAAAAVVLVGSDAFGSLEEYMVRDLAHKFGGYDYAAAAAIHVGLAVAGPLPSSEHAQEFAQLVLLAERLRAATTEDGG